MEERAGQWIKKNVLVQEEEEEEGNWIKKKCIVTVVEEEEGRAGGWGGGGKMD